MDQFENPHCKETPWSDLYHYKFNDKGQIVACGVKDHPTRVELFVSKKRYPVLNFELPRQKHELDNVQRMMEEAFERGKIKAKEDIRRLFRELIGI